jgi:GT2 family glycosyltransferase
MTPAPVTAVIVAYSGTPLESLLAAAASLRAQDMAPKQIICVDQTPDSRFGNALSTADPDVEVLLTGQNLGYVSASNLAASRATGDYLMFLNPDARADPDCLARLVEVAEAESRVAIVGAQIVFPDRSRVNAGDNPLHVSGISWAGRYGQAPELGPPREAMVVSGAAALVRRQAWEALGGFTEGFFMYYDDVDLAWRAWLGGWRVLFCPAALVEHDYTFTKGPMKWRCLERNRWWCVLAHYRAPTLLALAPLLLAVEAAIWRYAAREGWRSEKRAAWLALWRARRALLARRREIQAGRRIGDRAVLARMTPTVQTPLLDQPPEWLNQMLRLYHRLLLRGLR